MVEPNVSIEKLPADAVVEGEILSITTDRKPEQVLAEAKEAATALQRVIELKPNKVVINGKTYLTFEDWQTVARFYGLSAIVRSTEIVQVQGATGYKARAEVMDRKGEIVSAAEAMCLDNEPRWDSKPLYAILSMAQTRACSKALRHVLAFVPVLAGYQPTPAEEMVE